MNGTPVWLASLSRPRTGTSDRRLATNHWTPDQIRDGVATLRRALGDAGNPDRERVFRMQVTLCIHRALTADEIARLPAWFHADPATDLAGGPVEILWENEAGLLSTKPCLNPFKRRFDPFDPDIWLPVDCLEPGCPPCQARRALDEFHDAKVANLKATSLRDLAHR